MGPVVLFLLAACEPTPPPEPEPTGPAGYARLDRATFNRVAVHQDLSLFWRSDANGDGEVSPDEVAFVWGGRVEPKQWVTDGSFTSNFAGAYERMVHEVGSGAPPDGPPGSEARRRSLVLRELDAGRPTLVEHDLSGLPAGEREMVARVLEAATWIERLYARQRGVAQIGAELGDDLPSRSLFRRNQGPWCERSGLADDPDCHTMPAKRDEAEQRGRPERHSGLYPASLQAEDPNFCDTLAKHPMADVLLSPFSVVGRMADIDLVSVPYTIAWQDDMHHVRDLLRQAADALPANEAAFATYLRAAADGFESNEWGAADEAWVAMNSKNSRWYLRVGPDETYFEPCDRKAGFHMSFALIDPTSVSWQEKLDPLRSEMEGALAALAGPPYRARDVAFSLPDFIDVVLNAGDSRSAVGATTGQSLPNWGKVADEGRGRTVAMTGFGADPDSLAAEREVASALLCSATMAVHTDDPGPLLMSTILHEAAHNLGPSHSYTGPDGKTAERAFGGPLAAVMEELKAQTAAWWLVDWLVPKGVIDEATARAAHVADLEWAFGHLASAAGDASDSDAYTRLSAVQVGWMLERGALTWEASAVAANGRDQGCFELHQGAIAPAVDGLAREVLGMMARNDVPAATTLVERHLAGDGPLVPLLPVIAERVGRTPRPSYVYAVTY